MKNITPIDEQTDQIVLRSEPRHMDEGGLTFNINGSRIYIGQHDCSFFEKLLELPAEIKIPLMGISIDQMDAYLLSEKQKLKSKILSFFKKEWLDQECGEPVDLSDAFLNELCFGIKLPAKEIVKKANSFKLTVAQINQIIFFFESEKVYEK